MEHGTFKSVFSRKEMIENDITRKIVYRIMYFGFNCILMYLAEFIFLQYKRKQALL